MQNKLCGLNVQLINVNPHDTLLLTVTRANGDNFSIMRFPLRSRIQNVVESTSV